jgi:putative DNA primase/helicase
VKPLAIPKPAAVVIDEGFIGSGLRGLSGPKILITPEELSRLPEVFRRDGGGRDNFRTADLDAELTPTRRKLQSVLTEEGPLSRAALIAAGLTQDMCRKARGMEWRRKVEAAIFPGMTAEARRQALSAVAGCADVARMARLWRILANVLADDGPALAGGAEVVTVTDAETGASYRAIQLRWREDIRQDWIAPTLVIDATMQLDLVREYLPRVELVADIKVAASHQRVIQYPDRSFSKSSLTDPKAVDRLWQWCAAKAKAGGGKWLVVVQKSVEDAIRSRHEISDFIALAHHNGVAGIDQWGDVAGLIVVGRTLPPPSAVQSIVGALTGRHVEVSNSPDGWYSARNVVLRDAARNAVTVEVDEADDELAEAVRRSICEDEVHQIIGRPRGVNRTADDPVEIHVLGNLPLGLQIDELREWRPLTMDERLFADHGVWLSSAGDMAEVAGVGRKTIEKARQRMETFPYKRLYYGNVSILQNVTYRRPGAGRSVQEAVFDPRAIPDIAAFLEQRLGEVEVIEACVAASAAMSTAVEAVIGEPEKR